MFRRIWFSHPYRPSDHLLIALLVALAAVLILLLVAQSAGAVDVVELNSGAKIQGHILSRNAKSVVMNITVSGVRLKRTSDTPQKIIKKQSVKRIDTTSNATITSEAIVNATAKAIGQASE